MLASPTRTPRRGNERALLSLVIGARRRLWLFLGLLGACDSTDDAARAVRDGADAGRQATEHAVKAAGQLSQQTQDWLRSAGTSETVERMVATGTQIAPIANEIGVVVSETIKTDRAIEPIYQPIEPGQEAKVDRAIRGMPRTEVIDGVTVGFKQLDATDNAEMVKERAYLMMWRDEQRLFGFVYRSKRTIDIDKLVNDAPRLLSLADQAVKAFKGKAQ